MTTADIAALRAGHCLAVIPETFIACGEGGSYCSETCRLRTLLAEAVEIARTLGDQAEANADRDDGWMSQYVNISTRLAAIAKEGLT